MSQAKNGDEVKIRYTGKLHDGTVFDSSQDRPPLEFKIGGGSVIPGFEQSVVGMETGDTKTITIPPEEAYGPRREELVVNVKSADFPEHITPSVGQRLQISQPDGNVANVMIADIKEDMVTLDANHPLAGQTLTFDIELVAIA
ncbi:MAG: peptidylprolyl isomerase [Deltaproteobacteria bacterium]|nr:peptidylprolyl isomerase [Deltaproteobacteria bacterium]